MGDLWTHLYEVLDTKLYSNWISKDGIKALRLLDPRTDSECTKYILSNSKIKHKAISNFTFKNMTTTLPTKLTVTKSNWFKSDKIPVWKKAAYESKICSNCNKEE